MRRRVRGSLPDQHLCAKPFHYVISLIPSRIFGARNLLYVGLGTPTVHAILALRRSDGARHRRRDRGAAEHPRSFERGRGRRGKRSKVMRRSQSPPCLQGSMATRTAERLSHGIFPRKRAFCVSMELSILFPSPLTPLRFPTRSADKPLAGGRRLGRTSRGPRRAAATCHRAPQGMLPKPLIAALSPSRPVTSNCRPRAPPAPFLPLIHRTTVPPSPQHTGRGPCPGGKPERRGRGVFGGHKSAGAGGAGGSRELRGRCERGR